MTYEICNNDSGTIETMEYKSIIGDFVPLYLLH